MIEKNLEGVEGTPLLNDSICLYTLDNKGELKDMDERGPLEGIRVLDLTHVLAGPFATMLLGDLGAEVIKLERPLIGDETRSFLPHEGGESHYFLSVNRNKRSIAVDLKAARGRSIAQALIAKSDIVIENFRPGVASKLELDYESARRINPSIIYCSISGFGQDGPWADRTAFDIVIQALSGAMSITGEPGGPPMRAGVPLGDLAGGLFAVIGVLATLVNRLRTGNGGNIDISLLESSLGMLGYLAGYQCMTGLNPDRVGNAHQSIVPYGSYSASDGYIVIAVLTDSFWPKLCHALERPDLAANEKFCDNAKRLANRVDVDAALGSTLATRTVSEWCERLAAADVPHAPVLSVEAALTSEQVLARQVVRDLEHDILGSIQSLGPVIRSVGAPLVHATAPRALGSDTRSVLLDVLKFTSDQIRELASEGVVDLGKEK